MDNLDFLRSQLNRIFEKALPDPEKWSNLEAIKKLAKVRQDHDNPNPNFNPVFIADTVAAYRKTGELDTFRNRKYVCCGAGITLDDGWSVLGDPALLETLLAAASNGNPRQKRICFQCLLSCYWLFPLYKDDTPKSALEGWEKLRKWLDERLGILQNSGERNPDWFTIILDHSNLLKENPCDRYGKDLLNGDGSSLEEARSGLGIPRESWVMEEAILSRMSAAVALPDDAFKEHLDKLIPIASGTAELAISEILKRKSIALLVSRYARCADRPEHPALRDAAVDVIGNPWIRKQAWDFVRDENARLMVNSWLKRRLISDFFSLLSEDGVADKRRLEYWLRFEPAIEDIWLALGPTAEKSDDQNYKSLREGESAKDRWLKLVNPGSAENNAFIMRLGNWIIVEFGVRGNACYIYRNPAPFELSSKKEISLSKLKNRRDGKPFIHRDVRSATWEQKLDSRICPLIDYRPSDQLGGYLGSNTRPPTSPVMQESFINLKTLSKIQLYELTVAFNDGRPVSFDYNRRPIEDLIGYLTSRYTMEQITFRYVMEQITLGLPPRLAPNRGYDETIFWNAVRDGKLQIVDDRPNGALWVKVSRFPDIEQKLREWGFQYRDPRGWWRE